MPAVVANVYCKYSAHRNPAGVLPHVTHKVIRAHEVGSDVCLNLVYRKMFRSFTSEYSMTSKRGLNTRLLKGRMSK